jgi:hypothetical protein
MIVVRALSARGFTQEIEMLLAYGALGIVGSWTDAGRRQIESPNERAQVPLDLPRFSPAVMYPPCPLSARTRFSAAWQAGYTALRWAKGGEGGAISLADYR